jgi:hypothetical protein
VKKNISIFIVNILLFINVGCLGDAQRIESATNELSQEETTLELKMDSEINAEATTSEADISTDGFLDEYLYIYDSSIRPISRMPLMPVMVTVTGTHGEYHFSNGDWDLETIDYIMDVSEEAVAFVKDLLRYEANERLTIVYCTDFDYISAYDEGLAEIFNVEGSAAGWYLGNNVVFNYGTSYTNMLSINTHEVGHAFLSIMGMRSDFLTFSTQWDANSYTSTDYFEEGLCNVFQYMFVSITNNKRFITEMQEQLYENYGIENVTDTPSILREMALGWFNSFSDDLSDYHLLMDYNRDEMEHHSLQSYDTAASFIMFLLSNKSMDDFLRFYVNPDSVETVYGTSVEELIEQWHLSLVQ